MLIIINRYLNNIINHQIKYLKLQEKIMFKKKKININRILTKEQKKKKKNWVINIINNNNHNYLWRIKTYLFIIQY